MMDLTSCLSPSWEAGAGVTNPLKSALVFLVTNPQPETTYRWQALSHYHIKIHSHFGDFQEL